MNESHCLEPDVNTAGYYHKQIIALYLKFKRGGIFAICVSTINYPWIIVFHIWPLMTCSMKLDKIGKFLSAVLERREALLPETEWVK